MTAERETVDRRLEELQCQLRREEQEKQRWLLQVRRMETEMEAGREAYEELEKRVKEMSAVPQVRQVAPAQDGGKEDRKAEEEEGGKTEGSVATKVPLESRLPARGTQGQNESSNHTENAPSLQDTSPMQHESPAAVEVVKEAAEPRKGKKDHPRPTVSGPEHQQHGQKQKRPRQEGRRAHVFGDANAYAMKHAVLSMANWDKCVQFHTRPQATLEQVCDARSRRQKCGTRKSPLLLSTPGCRILLSYGRHPRKALGS